ncbi:hypothetical protein [Kitasatospora sp. NPDC057015]|uniref:hypothetical protein n=1 Tax=Kitasatospora sp. NPDC057015 TaxID=3346001 RepID=UPI0036274363
MTARRRKRIAWGLRGVALVASLAYLLGFQASHSGGLVAVEDWLDHPVLLLGSAVVLTVISGVMDFEFRTWWSQVGGAAALVALVFFGLPFLFGALLSGGDAPVIDQKAGPEHTDRVLTVTNTAFSIDPIYHLELVTGGGWSARHWDLGTWGDGHRDFLSAEWSGPDRITVTGEDEVTVFDLGSGGRPSEPQVRPR